MIDKIIQLMPVQNNMYLVSRWRDEETRETMICEERIIALALLADGDIGFVLISNESLLEIEKNYGQEIIFK